MLDFVEFYVCCKDRSFENVLEYYYDLGCCVQPREGKNGMEGGHSHRSFKELLWSWYALARDRSTREPCKCGRNTDIGQSSPIDWVWLSALSAACKPRDRWFDSQSGHMPGLWARSPGGGMQEATTH